MDSYDSGPYLVSTVFTSDAYITAETFGLITVTKNKQKNLKMTERNGIIHPRFGYCGENSRMR